MTTPKRKTASLTARRDALREEHAEAVREKIQVTQLVNVLQDFALGVGRAKKLTPARIKAIEMLLDKTVPNLASIKHEVDQKSVVFLIGDEPETPANEP